MTEQERTAELVQEAKEFLGLARLATRGPRGWGSQKKGTYDELMEGRFLYAHGSVDYAGEEREANGEFITAAREFADSTLPALLKCIALPAPAATSISGGAGAEPDRVKRVEELKWIVARACVDSSDSRFDAASKALGELMDLALRPAALAASPASVTSPQNNRIHIQQQARDLHYKLIEQFGLHDDGPTNVLVRKLLVENLSAASVTSPQNQIKTYQAWEDGPEQSITEYLKPMDEVDEEMFMHFAEVVPTQYHVGNLMQSGEAGFKYRGRYHYKTFAGYGEPARYYYLGILPPFKQPK